MEAIKTDPRPGVVVAAEYGVSIYVVGSLRAHPKWGKDR